MEFFQGRERCCEDEEVDMIGDMDKQVPYSSSSSSSSQYKGSTTQQRWGPQFYDKNREIWLSEQEAARCNYDGSSGKKIELKNNDDDNSHRRGESDGGGGGDDVVCIEREHMFDKVVTPSDVGKLNRLVIPKQHAEKYFPLDSSSNEKGLLLNFEDRTGKPWRFRYSYWNSSQSYVMTKGWSRFVKEKKLYAGDIVSFQRGAGETVKDRLYIDWRRRSDVQDPAGTLPPLPLLHPFSLPRSTPWGGLMMPQTMSMPMPPNDVLWQRLNYEHSLNHQQRTNFSGVPNGYNVVSSGSGPIFYLRSAASQQIGLVQPGGDAPMVFNSVPVVHGKASAKRLRLFGVNLDCPIPENPEYQFLDSPTINHPTIMGSFPPQIPPPIIPVPLQLSLYTSESSSPREQSESPNTSMSLDLDM